MVPRTSSSPRSSLCLGREGGLDRVVAEKVNKEQNAGHVVLTAINGLLRWKASAPQFKKENGLIAGCKIEQRVLTTLGRIFTSCGEHCHVDLFGEYSLDSNAAHSLIKAHISHPILTATSSRSLFMELLSVHLFEVDYYVEGGAVKLTTWSRQDLGGTERELTNSFNRWRFSGNGAERTNALPHACRTRCTCGVGIWRKVDLHADCQ